VQRTRRRGLKVAWVHLTHVFPLPANLGDLLRSFPKVIVPELNLGQMCRMVRAEYLVDAQPVTKVQGLPFTSAEIEAAIEAAVAASAGNVSPANVPPPNVQGEEVAS
jgi:2-oxoglutarate ferredoxin oxidoreductase subunit alpha